MNGKSVHIPLLGKTGYLHLNAHEPWLLEVIAHCLRTHGSGAVIDVGVNLGQTLLKVKVLDRDVPYIGFEPNPLCVAYVRRLIQKNNFPASHVVPVGLSDQPRVLDLTLYQGEMDPKATVVPGFRPGRPVQQTMAVPVFPFDQIRSALGVGEVSLVKIDVEGGELEVLRGMRSVLDASRPHLICEILPISSRDDELRSSRQREVVALLSAAGYVCFRLLAGGGVARVDEIEIHSDLSLINYLFAPREKAALVPPSFRPSPASRALDST